MYRVYQDTNNKSSFKTCPLYLQLTPARFESQRKYVISVNGLSRIRLNTRYCFLRGSDTNTQQSLYHQFLRNPNHKARDNNALETDYCVWFEIDWIGMDSACFLCFKVWPDYWPLIGHSLRISMIQTERIAGPDGEHIMLAHVKAALDRVMKSQAQPTENSYTSHIWRLEARIRGIVLSHSIEQKTISILHHSYIS